jgi:hypothetical protein
MYRSRSSSEIILGWQDEVERSIEAGSSPILELGVSPIPSDDLLSLLATQRWCAQRTDTSTPIFPGGGMGPQWIATLMRPLPRVPQAPEPVVLYTGTTEAEYLMSVAMLFDATETRYPGAPKRSAIPVSYFAQDRQPGKSVSWDALPFIALHISPREPQVWEPEVGEAVTQFEGDHLQDWLAWAGLLLALFLILLAILL